MLSDSGKIEQKDKCFATDVADQPFANHVFTRLVGKGVEFARVDFRYSTFDACYLRKCKFDSCDFTGCRFLGTSFEGSTFSGCKFDYATFERTIIDIQVLETNAPGHENLNLRFARSLRMNYQQLGDARSVNRAIKIELNASQTHYWKAWRSPESYYRHKYQGISRAAMFGRWLESWFLDLLWGNGESALKLCRSMVVLVFVVAIVDAFTVGKPGSVVSYFAGIFHAPQLLLGTSSPDEYCKAYLALLVFLRLAAMALFISVIIKRFNRR